MSILAELDPGFEPNIVFLKNYEVSLKDVDIVYINLCRGNSLNYFREVKVDFGLVDTERYLCQLFKSLLWSVGGECLEVSDKRVLDILTHSFLRNSLYAFDVKFFADLFGKELKVIHVPGLTSDSDVEVSQLGRNLSGNRIGFDLGGSDRKCAAVVDGEVIYSEEIEWSPYFADDPSYHITGICDSIERAASHLPYVDAIGGSSAGVIIDNQVLASSLFRGLSKENFETIGKPLFLELAKKYQVPLEIINDGDVTALAGSMELNKNGVLGVAMGTSLAAGYVNKDGYISGWLNELAFAPVDNRLDAPIDEWSGAPGCGVQYMSQQAVARLAPLAGYQFPDDMPFPEILKEIQEKAEINEENALKIYRTIGTYLGYSIAEWSNYYELSHVLVLGRVSSGKGGDLLLAQAQHVLKQEFPELAEKVEVSMPDEKNKRHGQAIAAASLPAI